MTAFSRIYEPRLSVHAWERYCERFGWADLATVSDKLIRGAAAAAIAAGATRVVIGEVAAICDKGLIVTVIPSVVENKNKHGRRRRVDRNRSGLKRRDRKW